MAAQAKTPPKPQLPPVKPHGGERLLRWPAVKERVQISRALWYQWLRTGDAPQPVRMNARVVAWRESDIDALIERLSANS